MTTAQIEKQKEAEDAVDRFLQNASPLMRLIMMQQLRIAMPHQPTTFDQLRYAITKELKRVE